uniref:RNase H type-1 domain-containing protein n=1 Tax=Cannabis sativa TaxID=3483 RepID=A0A803PAK7_CANSA
MLKKVNEDFLSHWRIYSIGLSTHSHDDGSRIQIIRWGLPRPDRIRVNVDYANIDGIGSVGVVALDGCRGLAVIQRLRLCDVDLISDCEALVLAIKKHQSPAWNVSFSFSHVLNLLLDLGVNFVWLSQSCNHSAHVLAK